MTATTDTRIVGLPKNKTGLFAGDTLQDVKSTRNQSTNVPVLPSHFRHNGSTNLLLVSSERNHHQLEESRLSKTKTQPYYPTDSTVILSSNDSHVSTNGIRSGFRPSTVRRQKSRIITATAHRDNNYRDSKDISSKQSFTPSLASARLISEIDQMNNKLKLHRDSGKNSRLMQNRDTVATPHSAVSYSTSCRLSSASTIRPGCRPQQRFSSAITNATVNTLASISTVINTSNKSIQNLSGIAAPSPPLLNEEDDSRRDVNHRATHTYQIPQQSNVGCESVFLPDSPSKSSIKSRSAKNNHRSSGNKSISCPFYVMYFTNLAMQQRHNRENDPTSSARTHKIPVSSRINTSYPRHQSTRRQINSPLSMNTYSTIDDDDFLANPTSSNKRLSTKITAVENENSHLLKDILRTTSWNHVQV